MFDDLNPQGFYPGENLPKLSKAEVLFFGLLMSGAIKLDRIPTTKAGEELDYFDEGDYEVMNPVTTPRPILRIGRGFSLLRSQPGCLRDLHDLSEL